MLRRSVVLAGMVAGSVVHGAQAQTMRSFTATRAASGEKLLRATLDFHAGNARVSGVPGDQLFQVLMRYDAERFVPVQQFEPRSGTLHLGLAPVGAVGVRVTSRAQLSQTAAFSFSRDVPLALTANFGASEAELELGGLTLTSLDVHASATRGTVNFGTPNRGSCRMANFSVTAGQLDIRRVANSNCREILVEGAAGKAILSFDGSWNGDVTLTVNMSMGGLTLRLPSGTGVRINSNRFLSTLNADGLVREDGGWVSTGYAQAQHKLMVELKTSVAGVNLEWLPR